MKKIPFLILIPLLLLSACSSAPAPQEEPSPTPLPSLPYCNEDDTDICLEGFGQENEEHTIILLKANNQSYRDIYLQVDEDNTFTCLQTEEFPENIYCSGLFFQNGEEILIEVYSNLNEELIAQGEFTIQYGAYQTPPNLQPPASYPNYPNYPN